MGGGPSGPPPVPSVLRVPVVPVPGVVWAQALLIHGVDCRRGMGALLGAARRLRVGECTVRGMRWLLGVGRRWGKRLSSVVVYLDRPVVVWGNSVWFGGVLHPVERYVFSRLVVAWCVVWLRVVVVLLVLFSFPLFLSLCLGRAYRPPSM